MTTYTWTDDAMRSGSTCDVDKVADNLMHLKYNAGGIQLGSCSTASATAEKAVTLDNFSLSSGATVLVTFTNANSSTAPTLNVNSTGAKSIYFKDGIAVDSTHPLSILAGETVEFYYNGTHWVLNQRAKYDSGWFAVASNNTYTKTHNLGTNIFKYVLLIADDSSGTNSRVCVDYIQADGFYLCWRGGTSTSTTMQIITSQYSVGYNTDGSWTGSAYYRIIAEVL